jgi:hypothetical protein
MQKMIFLQILLLAQHVSVTTMPIIRGSRVLYRRLLPVVFGASVLKLSVWCGAEGYVFGLRSAADHEDIADMSQLFPLIWERFLSEMIRHILNCVSSTNIKMLLIKHLGEKKIFNFYHITLRI